jgi:hypothetical protein
VTGWTLYDLRELLDLAEQEYALAEFIDDTRRQQAERAYWAGEIKRLRAAIEEREQQ